MGSYIAGTTVGGLVGRVVPSLVVDVSNWRVALFVCSLTTLAGTVVFAVLVPRSQFFTPKSANVHATIANVAAHVRNPVLIKLFALGFALMGGFVTVYNYLGYRLAAPSFGLASSVVGLLFVLYLAGTWTSVVAGRLADRRGRSLVLGVALPITVIGLLLTVPHALAAIVVGVGVFTGGFFAAHTVASGWVGAVAHRDRAEASALYLFSYYLAARWPAHSAASSTASAAGRPRSGSSAPCCSRAPCSWRYWCVGISAQRSPWPPRSERPAAPALVISDRVWLRAGRRPHAHPTGTGTSTARSGGRPGARHSRTGAPGPGTGAGTTRSGGGSAAGSGAGTAARCARSRRRRSGRRNAGRCCDGGGDGRGRRVLVFVARAASRGQ